MSVLSIEREVLVEAPVETVWRTVSEPEQIVQWFADRAELELRPGGEGVFVFRDIAPLVVEAVEPPTRLSFRWSHPDGEHPEVNNSVLVEFTLTADGPERTRLRVVETGLDLLDWTEDRKREYAEDHRNGWANFLDRNASLVGSSSRA
jgi:uncharacterized protein YndB with AHSA1/START domain